MFVSKHNHVTQTDSNGTCVVVVIKGMEQPLKSCQSLHIQKEVPFMD